MKITCVLIFVAEMTQKTFHQFLCLRHPLRSWDLKLYVLEDDYDGDLDEKIPRIKENLKDYILDEHGEKVADKERKEKVCLVICHVS